MLRKLGLATTLPTTAALMAFALAVAMGVASAASANPGKPIDPPDEGKPIVGQERYTPGGGFPSTRHPKLKGCSSSQGQWLRKAWRRAASWWACR